MQDYQDYEIILVDDGSSDGSGALADALQAQYGARDGVSIVVIHQPNAGLSAARNTGFAVAKSEFVCFVDSDDYWQQNVLGELMQQVEKNKVDVLRFRYQNVKEVNDRLEVFHPYKATENFAVYGNMLFETGGDFLQDGLGSSCYAWQFILRRDLLSNCLFTPGILFEDIDWTPRMLMRAGRVLSSDVIVYHYLWRETGITLSKQPDKVRKELENKLQLIGKLQQWAKKNESCLNTSHGREKGENTRLIDAAKRASWFETMMSHMVVSVMGILSTAMYAERQTYMRQLQQLRIRPLTTYRVSKRAQKKVKLFNVSPRLAVYLLHLKNT